MSVALVNHHKKANDPLLYCRLQPVWLYQACSHYLIIGKITGNKKKVIQHKVYVLAFSTTFFFFWNIFILRRTERNIINVQRSSYQAPIFLVRFYSELRILSTNFRIIFKYHIFGTSVQWGAESFHANRRTDRQKDQHDIANSHFSQCCVLKKESRYKLRLRYQHKLDWYSCRPKFSSADQPIRFVRFIILT